MEIRFSVKSFTDALSRVCGVISSRNTVPILACVRIECIGNDKVSLTSSDGDMWLCKTVAVDSCSNGSSFCVNGMDLLRVLRNLDEGMVELMLDESSSTLVFTYLGGKFTLPYLSSDEFPNPVTLKEEGFIDSTTMDAFCNAINNVRFCVADELLRPTLNGVYCMFNESGLTTVATDGNRLARFCDDSVRFDGDDNIILPRKFVNVLLSLNDDTISLITFNFDKSVIYITCDSFVMVSRVIEGRYPNYEAVIPRDSVKDVVVSRSKLLTSLKRVTPLGDTNSQLVSLTFADNKLTVDARDIDFNKSATETIDVSDLGDFSLKIGFKGNSLIDVVSNIASENIVMCLTDESHAAVFYGNENMKRESYVSILMPMLLA